MQDFTNVFKPPRQSATHKTLQLAGGHSWGHNAIWLTGRYHDNKGKRHYDWLKATKGHTKQYDWLKATKGHTKHYDWHGIIWNRGFIMYLFMSFEQVIITTSFTTSIQWYALHFVTEMLSVSWKTKRCQWHTRIHGKPKRCQWHKNSWEAKETSVTQEFTGSQSQMNGSH